MAIRPAPPLSLAFAIASLDLSRHSQVAASCSRALARDGCMRFCRCRMSATPLIAGVGIIELVTDRAAVRPAAISINRPRLPPPFLRAVCCCGRRQFPYVMPPYSSPSLKQPGYSIRSAPFWETGCRAGTGAHVRCLPAY